MPKGITVNLKGIKTGVKNLAVYERQAKAVAMRKAGCTYLQIKEECGFYSTMTACRSVQAYIRRISKDDVEVVKALELERLDKLHSAVWQQALGYEEVFVPPADQENGNGAGTPPDPNKPLPEPIKVLRPISVEDQTKAVAKCIQIMERRARLLGLDAPTKTDVIDKRAIEEFKEQVITAIAEVAKEFPAAGRAILRKLKDAGIG